MRQKSVFLADIIDKIVVPRRLIAMAGLFLYLTVVARPLTISLVVSDYLTRDRKR